MDDKGEPRRRKTLRLENYDYSSQGAYFITICCYKHKNYFGQIHDNQMQVEFNAFGQIAYNQWQKLTERFENLELGPFQIICMD